MRRTMQCPSCKKRITDLPHKLPFRMECPNCASYLHSCLNCRFYKKGQPNDCLVPNTDPISDRAHFNYCEEFAPKPEESMKEKPSKKNPLGEIPPSTSFDDLFK